MADLADDVDGEDELISKFKRRQLSQDDDIEPVRDYLITSIEKYYQITDMEEFKSHNLGTLEKIHDALKNDEPEILAEFGISPKRKKQWKTTI
jgi:hypothetical protein